MQKICFMFSWNQVYSLSFRLKENLIFFSGNTKYFLQLGINSQRTTSIAVLPRIVFQPPSSHIRLFLFFVSLFTFNSFGLKSDLSCYFILYFIHTCTRMYINNVKFQPRKATLEAKSEHILIENKIDLPRCVIIS